MCSMNVLAGNKVHMFSLAPARQFTAKWFCWELSRRLEEAMFARPGGLYRNILFVLGISFFDMLKGNNAQKYSTSVADLAELP